MLMDMKGHPASMSADELLAECDVRFLRRGGPGGQHRNKVSTAVVLRHLPTGVTAEANERRSQGENRQEALRRLRLQLAVDARSERAGQRPFEPSMLWQERSIGSRMVVSTSHDDFPALLAEALDALAAAEYDVVTAADWLGVSASQLTRFVQREPAAWVHLNDARRQRGLRPLH
jgi:RF-1 domain